MRSDTVQVTLLTL